MKFGKVDNPEAIDFTLPQDHPDTEKVFNKYENTNKNPTIYVGCAKWNRQDLKNFYPRGTKDELSYYAQQFNSIEMNATFYRIFPPEQFEKWRDKTPEGFKFFPKISQEISHYKQLKDVKNILDRYLNSVLKLENKLGTIFLQLHDRFDPKHFDKLEHFLDIWPDGIPLTVELRNTEWFNDEKTSERLYQLLENKGIGNTLVDTAGRRDIMHMRMTTPKPFIRYVGANHASDYTRLDDWVERIQKWKKQGVEEIDFFIHQNMEKESPMIAKYFIEQLNKKLGFQLKIPGGQEQRLF